MEQAVTDKQVGESLGWTIERRLHSLDDGKVSVHVVGSQTTKARQHSVSVRTRDHGWGRVAAIGKRLASLEAAETEIGDNIAWRPQAIAFIRITPVMAS